MLQENVDDELSFSCKDALWPLFRNAGKKILENVAYCFETESTVAAGVLEHNTCS